MPSTVAKRILNPFRLGCKLFARLSAQGAEVGLIPKVVWGTNSLSQAKKENQPDWVGFFFCERAVKRCVNVGKNSKKYIEKLLDKLEFVWLCLIRRAQNKEIQYH